MEAVIVIRQRSILYSLFFLSGMAGLIYASIYLNSEMNAFPVFLDVVRFLTALGMSWMS
jgi:hypothetical protein